MGAALIAVVDDDPRIRRLIRRTLEPEGFAVDEARDAAELFALLAGKRYDLVTLDIGLPDGNGFDIAKQIKAAADTAIIMITGKGEVFDRVVGLEIGADDYVAKPFHVRELLARVRAVLRRSETAKASTEGEPGWRVGRLRLFPDRRALLDAADREIALTCGEFDLLLALVKANGRALSRDRLMDALHGPQAAHFDRAVDNVIARLRKRLPEGTIKTIRTVGYQLGTPAKAERLIWPEPSQA